MQLKKTNFPGQCGAARRAALLALAAGLLAAGCSTIDPDAHLAAFSSQMTGANQVPPVATQATGRVLAMLDRNTLLFRWRVNFNGLSSGTRSGHFHGPATIGRNAPAVLSFGSLPATDVEGRATLTPEQAADLLAGKWYASIHTAAHPAGEIRGQMILRGE